MTMRKMPALADSFVKQIRTSGPRQTFRMMGSRFDSLVRSVVEDRRHGVATTRQVWDRELGIEDQRNHWYVATDYQTVRSALRHVHVRPLEDVFVDFGSGKGRIVMIAAGYPFRRVMGVEFSPELHRIAEQNLAALRRRACGEVKLVLSDATQWQMPDDATVLYFFNPFEGEILVKVFANIQDSFQRNPRKITVVYVRPERFFEKQVAWEPWLTRTIQMPCREGTVAIYESKMPLAKAPARLTDQLIEEPGQ